LPGAGSVENGWRIRSDGRVRFGGLSFCQVFRCETGDSIDLQSINVEVDFTWILVSPENLVDKVGIVGDFMSFNTSVPQGNIEKILNFGLKSGKTEVKTR
jgi:hypothetical protein